MLEIKKGVKKLDEQSPSDKMYVLKQMSHHMLGAKWKYYHKIKTGKEGLSLLKEKSLMEQMKATQSALRFTSKSAKKSYRTVYQSCIKDITSNTGMKKENFPILPEVDAGKEPPSLTSGFDAVIISWTPIKFFLPAKNIREKGKATQRHTEGLVAKLFFKVAGYYAIPENWDNHKLTHYLRQIKEDASYQDVLTVLEPLKNDLNQFIETYEPFKFGQAALSKNAEQDTETFDDAMAVESFESQVKSLYWYAFIYHAVELFIFRYYLTLITATNSNQAVRYLAAMFEPVFEKVIENRILFAGSLETDRSKKAYRLPFKEYEEKRESDPRTSNLKTGKGVFESYVYNLNLLRENTISFEMESVPEKDSAWADFLRTHILARIPKDDHIERSEEEADELDDPMPDVTLENRQYIFMQLMATIVDCTLLTRSARHKILERFKKRVITDKGLAEKQIEELNKKGEKKIIQLQRKADKIKRLKQVEAAESFAKDVEIFKQKLDDRCAFIRQKAARELNAQKERLQKLFKEISKEDSLKVGTTANKLFELLQSLDKEGEFTASFLQYVIDNIQHHYSRELEPFYENIFDILQPSTQEKIVIIQALKKSGGEKVINLSLSEQEEAEFEEMVSNMKSKIEGGMPGIFKSKIILQAIPIPVDDLFKISIDNNSMRPILRSKVSQPNTGKQVPIPGELAKAMMVLNMVINPVPRNSIILSGKENEKDPAKAINTTLLKKLLADHS